MSWKRLSAYHAAARTAFGRSRGSSGRHAAEWTVTIRPTWLAFVVAFPGVIGALALGAALSRGGTNDGAYPLGIGALLGSVVLLALGLKSRLVVTGDQITVRFFGLRGTTVRFADLASATFGMVFPSISFAISLRDNNGKKAIVHANWWRDEATFFPMICSVLVQFDVPMDRGTARVVSQVLGIKRPKPRIVHHALLRKDRTW